MQALQYLWPSTRVLTAKYWSTDGEVLEFCFFATRDYRYSVSRAKEVNNIGPYILKRLTIILLFLLAIVLKQPLNIRQEVFVIVIGIVAALRAAKANRFMNFRQ